jgi:pyruvate,water dikinase
MDDFIEEFGHRAPSSWEIFSPRWSESPSQVSVLAEAAKQHGDPASLAAEQSKRASEASGLMSGWMKSFVSRTQEYLLLRENQRFHFDRLLWAWKRQLMAVERMTGLEIRFLEIEELDALIAGGLAAEEAEERISRRKESWVKELERRAMGDEPPTFTIGTKGVEFDEAAIRLQGTGTSPGVVTGMVRVLRSPADAERLQPGDILVARATDPGWTPLFLKVGGVVVELGGMLSHGAVVAREYGLPAVVNVPGATTVLKDGQMVTVDGRQGVVWVR